jgi:hypothetical protein
VHLPIFSNQINTKMLDNSPAKENENYELVINHFKKPTELSEVDSKRAQSIKKAFEPFVKEFESFADAYKSIMQDAEKGISEELTQKARRLRLALVPVRTATGKTKDKQKARIKLEDKEIMSAHNAIVKAISDKEAKLAEVENHFINIEKERIAKLQEERVIMLSKFVEEAFDLNLGEMEEEDFDSLLTRKQKEYNTRVEEERLAELAKIAEAERLAKIDQENVKLRELARVEAQKLADLEAKLKAKDLAEKQAKEALLSGGDSAKFEALISDLDLLKYKYDFESDEAKKLFYNVNILINKTKAYINEHNK